ncbi:hypothetical protein PR048_003340 [Dryococelus australis]|uniref:TTF-type domain-containing protein n=1 Tax=Dryococelus australis TaxID=614101 RepID=A0ABQ9IMN6_9NEOP|nr:hypothetical protein PR048_003340 [Dryococelus australis]
MLLRRPCQQSETHRVKETNFPNHIVSKISWLSYSEKLSGAFCKFCVLFYPCDVGNGSHEAPSSLVSKPFNRWKDALKTRSKLMSVNYHKRKTKLMQNENRKIISAIVETILFCGRQEIYLYMAIGILDD